MSKPRSRVVQTAATLVLVLAMSACASGSGRQQERGEPMEIQVINDLIPPRSVTVTIEVSLGGRRNVLGSVAPSQTRSFKYRLGVAGIDYVLTAEDAERHQIKSRSVPLDPEDIVVWSLRNNQLELRGTP